MDDFHSNRIQCIIVGRQQHEASGRAMTRSSQAEDEIARTAEQGFEKGP